jgi:hypothetical protein
MNVRLPTRKLFAACALLLFQNVARAGDEAAAMPTRAQVAAEFDIAKRGDVIVLPVTIGEKAYPFLLSTASTRTVADSRLRPLLGKRIESESEPADPIESAVDEYPPLSLKIGDLAFVPEKPLICRNLRLDREFLGHELYGIVGMDFLKDRVVQIDFDEGKLRVLAKFPRPIPPEADVGVLLGGQRRPEMLLYVFDGYPQGFTVDTTFLAAVSVRSKLMDDLLKKKLVTHVQDARLLKPEGGAEPRMGLLRSLTVEKWTLKNLSLLEGTYERVGLAVLSQFQVIFDFTDNTILLTPGAKFGQSEGTNWGGMDFLMKKQGMTVVRIAANHPAAGAGIQPGDVLSEANGKPAAEWSAFEIRHLFVEQKIVRAKFLRPEQESRGAEEFTVTLKDPKFSVSTQENVPTGGTDDSKP